MAGSVVSIAIDALGIDRPGGARTATLYLLAKAVQLKPSWQFIIFVSKNEPLLEQNNVQQIVLPIRKGILARSIFQIYLPIFLIFHKVDLVHFTKSQASLVPGVKCILTIFDMTTLLYPEQFSLFSVWYWRYIQKYMVSRVDAIVTISNDAAKDIIRILGVDEQKVHTIPLASQFEDIKEVDINFINQVIETRKLPEEFLLYVGLLAKKKNLDTIVKAIRLLKDQGRVIPKLLLVGPLYLDSDASAIIDTVHELGLDDEVLYFGEVEREELKIIFEHTICLLQPSVHEGFGLTALEALTLGVPVIASNAGSLPEIISDSGLLINNYTSPEAWADAIWLISNDEDLKFKMINAGKKVARRFSWENSAQKLILLYSKVLGKE